MIEGFDFAILEFFQQIHHPMLTVIFRFFTIIGEAGGVWILIGMVLLCGRESRKYGIILLLSLLLCLILGNGVLKNLIARPRPCWRFSQVEMLIGIPKDFSFPSGHTFSSVAAAICIFYWNHRYGSAAFIVAGLIAASRLYFFVHYPTDIVGGIVFGAVAAMLSIWLVTRVEKQVVLHKKKDLVHKKTTQKRGL